jgi:hypothetical protein
VGQPLNFRAALSCGERGRILCVFCKGCEPLTFRPPEPSASSAPNSSSSRHSSQALGRKSSFSPCFEHILYGNLAAAIVNLHIGKDMRDGLTTQPARTAAHLRARLASHFSNPPVTGLKNACPLRRARSMRRAGSPWRDSTAHFDPGGPACPDTRREIAAMGRLNNRAISPSFLAFLCHFCRSFAVQNVISRTSVPAALRLHPTFAAASHQNAPASPPLANLRRTAVPAYRPRITSHRSPITSHAFPDIRYRD